MSKEKQTEMFPEQARRKALMHDIPSAYSAAERVLPDIGDKATFFSNFGKYAKCLDVEHDRETVVLNLRVAREKVGDLLGAIDQAESQLVKVAELEEEMRELEDKLGIPSEQRWSGRLTPIPAEPKQEQPAVAAEGEQPAAEGLTPAETIIDELHADAAAEQAELEPAAEDVEEQIAEAAAQG